VFDSKLEQETLNSRWWLLVVFDSSAELTHANLAWNFVLSLVIIFI